MKKKLLITISIICLLAILSSCGINNTQALIAKGDEAMAKYNYIEAAGYYREAGDAEKEREAYMTNIKSAYIYGSNYAGAIDYLRENEVTVITEEEIMDLIAERLTSQIENLIPEYEQPIAELLDKAAKATDNLDRWDYEEAAAEQYAALIDDLGLELRGTEGLDPPEGTELRKVLNKYYDYYGWCMVNSNSYMFYSAVNWDEVTKWWSKCTEGTGLEIANGIKLVQDNQYTEGYAKIKENTENTNLLRALIGELSEDIRHESAMEYFEYQKAYAEIFIDNSKTYTMSQSYESMTLGFKIRSFYEEEEEMQLSQTEYAELKDTCGTAPEGKILVLHAVDDETPAIHTGFMNYLPGRFLPTNFASVEYVIVMTWDSELTGATFQNGTKELRENATITLYNATTGEILFEEVSMGPTSYMMTYNGDPPAYYSAGAPTVCSYFKDAIAEIEKYL